MKKIIKNYGNTFVIVFTQEDRKIYDIEEGDIIDFSDMVVIKKKSKKK